MWHNYDPTVDPDIRKHCPELVYEEHQDRDALLQIFALGVASTMSGSAPIGLHVHLPQEQITSHREEYFNRGKQVGLDHHHEVI